MKTGNHIADFDPNEKYFDDDHEGIIHLKRCDFCDEMENEEFINYDYEEGKKTGVVYCCDCEESYLYWKKENHVS